MALEPIYVSFSQMVLWTIGVVFLTKLLSKSVKVVTVSDNDVNETISVTIAENIEEIRQQLHPKVVADVLTYLAMNDVIRVGDQSEDQIIIYPGEGSITKELNNTIDDIKKG